MFLIAFSLFRCGLIAVELCARSAILALSTSRRLHVLETRAYSEGSRVEGGGGVGVGWGWRLPHRPTLTNLRLHVTAGRNNIVVLINQR